MRRLLSIGLALLILAPCGAEAKKGFIDWAVSSLEQNHSYSLPATGQLEIAFSPNEGAENLIIKVINSAKSEVRMLAYSFTSAPVVDALLRAKSVG